MHGILIPDSQTERVVPKWGLNRSELEFAIGSKDLVRRMIQAGWIVPVHKRLGLYDAGDAAKCWARILRGEDPS